jgi:hypothetical protein
MANTTISQLTPLTGTAVANDDLFLIYDASATAEKSISASELKNMVGNGAITITTSGTSDALIITSTDSGATAAPDIVFYRNSSSPAASDLLGNVLFRGKSSLAANVDYASIGSYITSTTSGVEKGGIAFSTVFNGTLSERIRFRDDGGVGIGGVGLVNATLSLTKNVTGGTGAHSIYNAPTIQSDVTNAAYVTRTITSVANSPFTLSNLYHYSAEQGTFGASATVSSQIGYLAGPMLGGTQNIGFFQNAVTASSITTGKTVFGFSSNHPIATGGGTAWNFYSAGTASNYFNGNTLIGTLTPDGSKLLVSGNAAITSTLSVTGNITGGAQIAGKYTALSNGTTAMALATNAVAKVTPTATATYTTTVAPAGSRATIVVVTSGTTSYTITFGTGFKTVGTLATGTVTTKTFAIDFVSDGTSMIETSRTTAM